jgi:acetyl esterase/lipase
MIRNVTTPTLEAYLPDPDKATGAGVIVAPGGGMRFLSYDTEGVWVAQWLAEHGVAAFVLKYRTIETPADDKAFAAALAAMFAQLAAAGGKGVGPLEGSALATADGVRALQVAREHAQEWRVDPNRIGFMGFSAGARVTVGVVSEGGKPAFAAPIYGGAFGETVNLSDAPPMFLAVSGNDGLAGPTELSLFEQLRAARKPVELHVYHTGGHGYGLEPHANSSAHWIDEFYWWLESNGWLKRGR